MFFRTKEKFADEVQVGSMTPSQVMVMILALGLMRGAVRSKRNNYAALAVVGALDAEAALAKYESFAGQIVVVNLCAVVVI